MRRNRCSTLAAIAAALLLPLLAAAAPTPHPGIRAAVQQLFTTVQFSGVAISPDGRRVAWVESIPSPGGGPAAGSAIYVKDLTSPAPAQRLTAADAAPHDESGPVWSPDSRQLLFLSDASGQSQIYVATPGEAPRQITHVTGDMDDATWSPDGRSIAFLFIRNAPRAAGPLAPMTIEHGVIGHAVFEQRLTTVDLASGTVHEISPADMYIYEYGWAPDGRRFAVTAAHGAGDPNWWVARLYTLDRASGQMHEIYKPDWQIAKPRFSPDGSTIAFIQGLMSDEGSTGGDIDTIPADGGAVTDITPHMRATATWLTWKPGTHTILFGENVDGSAGLASISETGGPVTTLWTGEESISGAHNGFSAAIANDGVTSAVVRSSFAHPPEVWAGKIGTWQQLTHANDHLQPNWGKAVKVHWTNGGFHIQGWLLYPRQYDPSRRYPMVVLVHGGPGAANTSSWPRPFYNTTLLSDAGYFVLYPNPRGSFGQGEAFTQANRKDFGYGDFKDIEAGADSITHHFPVDPHRIGITGWSYGGYMTMWAVTQTTRFRAAVAGAGIANWQSYYGENDIDTWMIPFFGASVYDDPAVYAKSAPITFIKNVKTPTLVLVGDRDGECPTPQSYEFWHALKTLGVKTQLVVYADEGHFIWRPSDEQDIVQRMIGWFDANMQ